MIHNNKFSLAAFDTLKDKQIKAREYHDTIQKPLEQLSNNIQNVAKALDVEKRKVRPKSVVEAIYDSLLKGTIPSVRPTKERPKSIEISPSAKVENIEKEQEERRKTISTAGFKSLLEKIEEYNQQSPSSSSEEEEEWEV